MSHIRMTPEEYDRLQAKVRTAGPGSIIEYSTAQEREVLTALMAGKKSKYGNKKTIVDGLKFDSKREADRYLELKLLCSAGEIHTLRLQPHIACDVNGMHVCTYVADFAYTKAGDSRETFEDAKGHRTALYILKSKLVKACHGIEIEEV